MITTIKFILLLSVMFHYKSRLLIVNSHSFRKTSTRLDLPECDRYPSRGHDDGRSRDRSVLLAG